jgi:branched-chain amino acid transport system substrate-binding protein
MLALIAMPLAGCGERDEITLGASLPLTGKLASAGRYYRDGYQMAVEQINADGGIAVGATRRRLALKIWDNESDSKLAAQQHEDLAESKINFMLGSYSGFDVLAGSSVAQRYQIPMVQGGGSAARIFTRGNKYVFGTLPASDESFRSTIAMMSRLNPQPKTVALIVGDDPSGIGVANGTKALLEEAGLELVLFQQYSGRTPNFSNILPLVKAKAPDVLLWSGPEAPAIAYIRQAKASNVSPNLFTSLSTVGSSASFLATLGKDANYLFGITPWLPHNGLKDKWFGDAEQFARAYESKLGYAPDYHVAAAVAAVEALAVAIEAAGTEQPERVRDAIPRLDFESIYGRIRFGATGQIVMPRTVIQIQNGQIVEIFTDKLVNQPLYPVPPWSSRS